MTTKSSLFIQYYRNAPQLKIVVIGAELIDSLWVIESAT
jgi:hypothetical protein